MRRNMTIAGRAAFEKLDFRDGEEVNDVRRAEDVISTFRGIVNQQWADMSDNERHAIAWALSDAAHAARGRLVEAMYR
jgi:hypothetical protein